MRDPDGAQVSFEAELALAAGVCNVADARLVDLVARALAEERWEGHGIHTPVQWLMWTVGVQRTTAMRVLLMARRAAELPTVMSALAAGRLSLDQAAMVARFTPADFEATVCELAENATVSQIATATRSYDFDYARQVSAAGDPEQGDPTPDPVPPEPARDVSFGADEQGGWQAHVHLPVDEGAVVEAALRKVRDDLHTAARRAAQDAAAAAGNGIDGTDAQLGVGRIGWADALVGMAHDALAGDSSGATSVVDADIVMHLEVPVGAPDSDGGDDGDGDGDQWMGSLHLGPALPAALRRYLACNGTIGVQWESDGVPVGHSRRQRIVPRRIRRAIEHRDRGCRVPGCDQHLWVQVHHLVHWEDGGDTVTANLLCLCPKHHRLHHQGHLGIVGNADVTDGITYTNAYGLVLGPTGRPTVPRPSDLPTPAPYRGPTGERLQKQHVIFNPDRPRRPCEPSRPLAGAAVGPAPPGRPAEG